MEFEKAANGRTRNPNTPSEVIAFDGRSRSAAMIESLEARIAPATFVVTTLEDGGGRSLRGAIAAANESPGADTIVFQPGLHGVINLTSREIGITDTLSIKGPGSSKLGISAGGISRVFEVLDPDGESPLSISGLSFFSGDDGLNGDGGAILSSESLKVKDCVFRENDADRQGGAIAVFDGSETAKVSVDIRDSVFVKNRNGAFGGGAVDISVDGSIVLKNCLFAGNVSGTRGGALSISSAESNVVRVEKCQFYNNRAPEHGALSLSLASGTAIIAGNEFIANEAERAGGAAAIFGGSVTFDRNLVSQNRSFEQGGGLIVGQFSSLTISHSQFLKNTSQLSGSLGGGGGAISIGGNELPGSTALIVDCLFDGNTSTRGGGIEVASSPFDLKIIGTSFFRNHSTTEGGGIYIAAGTVPADSASVKLMKSKISNNVADNLGGGVFGAGDGVFQVKSSILTGNVAAQGGGLYLGYTSGVLISNSVISTNNAESDGGGIVAASPLELRDTKLMENSSGGQGGGVYSTNRLDVVESAVIRNFALTGGGIYQRSIESFSLLRSKVTDNVSQDLVQVVDA